MQRGLEARKSRRNWSGKEGGRGEALLLAGIRGGHGKDGEPWQQCQGTAHRQSLQGGTVVLPAAPTGALEPFPFVPSPDLEANG